MPALVTKSNRSGTGASAECKRSEVIVDPGAGLVPLMGVVCVDMVSFLNVDEKC
jgi:hypothetical protein